MQPDPRHWLSPVFLRCEHIALWQLLHSIMLDCLQVPFLARPWLLRGQGPYLFIHVPSAPKTRHGWEKTLNECLAHERWSISPRLRDSSPCSIMSGFRILKFGGWVDGGSLRSCLLGGFPPQVERQVSSLKKLSAEQSWWPQSLNFVFRDRWIQGLCFEHFVAWRALYFSNDGCNLFTRHTGGGLQYKLWFKI